MRLEDLLSIYKEDNLHVEIYEPATRGNKPNYFHVDNCVFLDTFYIKTISDIDRFAFREVICYEIMTPYEDNDVFQAYGCCIVDLFDIHNNAPQCLCVMLDFEDEYYTERCNFVTEMGNLLSLADSSIMNCKYIKHNKEDMYGEEFVVVEYKNKYHKQICVTADSKLGILSDVINAIL